MKAYWRSAIFFPEAGNICFSTYIGIIVGYMHAYEISLLDKLKCMNIFCIFAIKCIMKIS